jgi:hypothetical protein
MVSGAACYVFLPLTTPRRGHRNTVDWSEGSKEANAATAVYSIRCSRLKVLKQCFPCLRLGPRCVRPQLVGAELWQKACPWGGGLPSCLVAASR